VKYTGTKILLISLTCCTNGVCHR